MWKTPISYAIDDGKRTTENHRIGAHGTTIMDVVYTNMVESVDVELLKFEQLLRTEQFGKYRIVGLDLQYTWNKQEIAVMQLAVGTNVLVFHYYRSSKIIPALKEFLMHKGITFASVDSTKDKRMLARAGIEIPDGYHVDLQDLFQLEPKWDDKVGKGTMAEVIIDKEYGTIKDQFPKERDNYWECKPLEKINLKYAALGAYVSYEMYRRMMDMDYGQRHILATPVRFVCTCCDASVEGTSRTIHPIWPLKKVHWPDIPISSEEGEANIRSWDYSG